MTSATNTGTPAAESCSAMSWSVFVLPVPVAPGDEAVAVERRERDADRRVAVDGAVEDAAAEVERGALGRVGGGDRLVEVGAHGAGRLSGRRGRSDRCTAEARPNATLTAA